MLGIDVPVVWLNKEERDLMDSEVEDVSVATLNDQGVSFARIADLIERYYKEKYGETKTSG